MIETVKTYKGVFIPSKHCLDTKDWDQGRRPLSPSKDVGQAYEWKSISLKRPRTSKMTEFNSSVLELNQGKMNKTIRSKKAPKVLPDVNKQGLIFNKFGPVGFSPCPLLAW